MSVLSNLNPGRLILAPMEGLADDLLRDVLTRASRYDWCVTEFVRVSATVMPGSAFVRISPELLTGSRTKAGILFLVLGLLSGCIYLPETKSFYNPDCMAYQRQMVLQEHQVGAILGCQDDGCAALLVLAGAVSAASYVVSGSVVVVGKVVYWLERQAQCVGTTPGTPTLPESDPPSNSP